MSVNNSGYNSGLHMARKSSIVAISILCFIATPCFSQKETAPASARLKTLLQRAEQGDAHAQFELGFCYQYGIEGQKDLAEALRWYRKATDQGDADARLNLAKMYFDGEGVKRDYAEAANWYGCPKPSESILTSCSEIRYSELPKR